MKNENTQNCVQNLAPNPIAEFQRKLTNLINESSIDNLCNVPDYILAEFLIKNLETWRYIERILTKHKTKNF